MLDQPVNISEVDVSDPDGNLQGVNYSVSNGSNTFISQQRLTNISKAPELFQLNNSFTPTDTNKWYNITITAFDTDGATDTSSMKQFVEDVGPETTIFEPNNTVYTFTPGYRFRINNDGDADPNEFVTCDVWNGTTRFRTVSAFENASKSARTFTGTLDAERGSRNFITQCDDGQITTNTTQQYRVNISDFRNRVAPAEPLFEAENLSYTADVRIGDMVWHANISLQWNQSVDVTDTFLNTGSFVNKTQFADAQLTDTNNTVIPTLHNASVLFTNESGLNETITFRSDFINQSLWQGFFFKNSSITSPIVETDEYDHTFWMKSRNDRPGFSPRHVFWRDKSTYTPDLTDTASNKRYDTDVFVDNISSAQASFNASTDVVIGFDGKTRTIRQSFNDTVTVDRFVVAPCSSNQANTTALNFTSYDENNRDNKVSSTFDTAFAYWKDPSFKKVVNASSTSTSHTYCLEPGYAELTAQGTRQQSILSATDKATRSFYLLKQTLDNTTTDIPLYLLNTSEATQITFEIEDSDGNSEPSVVLSFERYFPSDDANIRVGMAKTSSDGSTQAKLAVGEEQTYQIKAYNLSSSLLDIFESEIFTTSPVTLQLGEDGIINYIDRIGRTDFSCVQDVRSINCSYSSTAALDTITLNVQRFEVINKSTACNIQSSSSSGVLVCQGLNTTDKRYSYTLDVLFDDGAEIRLDSGSFGNRNLQDFGVAGVFVTALVVMALALAGAFSPTVSIFLTGIGVIVGYVTGMLSIGITAVTSFLLVGAFLIYRMNQT